jgi:hypothetical protein
MFIREFWKNRSVANPNRYLDQDEQSLTLTPDPGEVYEPGTPVNAARLNRMETGMGSLMNAVAMLVAQVRMTMTKARGIDTNAALIAGHKAMVYEGTLLAANWTTSGAGFENITSESFPIDYPAAIYVRPIAAHRTAYHTAYVRAKSSASATSGGNIAISFECEIAPTTNLQVRILVIRLVTASNTGITAFNEADKAQIVKPIWSGSWASGNITVPHIAKYRTLLVRIGDSLIPCSYRNNTFRGGMPFLVSGSLYVQFFSATLSGTTLTLTGCKAVTLAAGASVGTYSDQTISEIFGVADQGLLYL